MKRTEPLLTNVLGENPANVEVTMLLDNGVDLHSYQPTADDILKISTCDMFVYVGGESDEWVEDTLAEATNKNMIVINLLDVLETLIAEENSEKDDTEIQVSENTSDSIEEQADTVNADAPELEEINESEIPVENTEGIDVNLTQLSSTMVYAEVYNMMIPWSRGCGSKLEEKREKGSCFQKEIR